MKSKRNRSSRAVQIEKSFPASRALGGGLVAIAMLVLFVPLDAAAVPVAGRVEVSGELGDGRRVERQNWEIPNGVIPPDSDERRLDEELAVVLIGGNVKEPIGCGYDLRGGDFPSRTMAARAGSTIHIANRDGCSHELYADGLDALTGSELSPGQTANVTVPASGHVEIRDRLYPHVETHLHAIANLAACGDVTRKGYVRLGDIPAGSYELQVLRGAEVLATEKVEVGDRRDVALSAITIKVTPLK